MDPRCPPSKSLVGGVVGGSSHSRDKPLVDLCDCAAPVISLESVGSSCRAKTPEYIIPAGKLVESTIRWSRWTRGACRGQKGGVSKVELVGFF